MDTSFIGKKTAQAKVVVDRVSTSCFATAILDDNPIYHDMDCAKQAGFSSIPTPPTFGFAWTNFGAYPEIQPQLGPDIEPVAMTQAMAELMSEGGLLLHGEQEFQYHRNVLVGDTLLSTTTIVDMYEKESKGRRMKFLITETEFTDDQSGELALTCRMNLVCRI